MRFLRRFNPLSWIGVVRNRMSGEARNMKFELIYLRDEVITGHICQLSMVMVRNAQFEALCTLSATPLIVRSIKASAVADKCSSDHQRGIA